MEENKEQIDRIRRFDNIIRRQAGLPLRAYREDGFMNLLNKYGTQKDFSEHYQFEAEPEVPDSQIVQFYEGNGLFAKIIDAPAEEAIRHGFTLEELDDKNLEHFYVEELDDLEWDELAETAIKWTRLYGGAVAVMLIDDGRGLEEPLDWDNIRSVDNIQLFDRSLVQPDTGSIYKYEAKNPFSNRTKLGLPERYYIASRHGSFTVHQSRCLVFQNGVLPENASNQNYQLWGVPEYIRIRRAVRDTEVSHGSPVKFLDRSVQPIYSMKDLANELATEGGEDRVLQRLQIIDMARGLLNTIAIDSEGESYDFRSFSYNGVAEVISVTCNYLSAITQIPQTILFGRSPAGMNATGDSDMENYYNFVARIQKKMLRANLKYLLNVIFKAGANAGKIENVPHFHVKFNPLWSMSEAEQASLDLQKANIQQARAATAKTYFDMQVLSSDEIRKSLADDSDFDIEQILDDYTPEELEANKPQPTQQEGMPGMPPGMAPGAQQPSGQVPNGSAEQTGGDDPISKKNLEDWKRMWKPQIDEYHTRKAIEETDKRNLEEWKSLWKEQIDKFHLNKEIERTDAENLEKWKELWKERIDSVQLQEEIDRIDAEYREELKRLWHLDSEEKPRGKYSVGVVVIKNGKVLCGKRISNTYNGLICGPGGHVEAGENARDAAIRETQEEFGITPKNLKYIGKGEYEPESGLTPFIFVCTEFDGTPKCDEYEMTNASFIPINKVKDNDRFYKPFYNGVALARKTEHLDGAKYGFDKVNRRNK